MKNIDDFIKSNLMGKITGVIHVGAHNCEEFDFYQELGVNKVLWFEADVDLYTKIKQKYSSFPNHEFFNYAVTNENSTKDFHIANNDGASSSLLNFKQHAIQYVGIKYIKTIQVSTITLDTFFETTEFNPEDFNYLYLDTQGSEYDILTGSKILLNYMKYIYCELNFSEMYEGCKLHNDIDSLLAREYGFVRSHTESMDYGWGDGFYQKV